MKNTNFITVLIGATFILCTFNLCTDLKEPKDTASEHLVNAKEFISTAVGSGKTCDCAGPNSLDGITINFNSTVPGDISTFNQNNADCFAWQEFISLNWPENGNNDFGAPGDLSFVQWENYMPKDVLLQPNGAPPPPWGTTLVADHHVNNFEKSNLSFNPAKTKLLLNPSKFGKKDTLTGMDIHQAAPFKGPNWLGGQNNTNVWYEIMVNKDHYDFINDNGYYNAAVQHDSVKAGIPINFPKGSVGGLVGAIELKAAWMEMDDPSNLKWNRYKLSKAVVQDPTTGQLRNTTVALVGLHILHKTENQPTWVWATFEQIDNVPGSSSPPDGYNFHNPNCTSKTVNLSGGTTATVGCTANTSPPYYLNQATPVPVQISRLNPIDPSSAAPINQLMQSNIKKFYPSSVWQYYQLVDVIWSATPQPDPTQPIRSPRNINVSAMQSGGAIVANTTLESYAQTTTCYQCHVGSTIAPYPPDAANDNVFGDFSFVIGAAKYDQTKFNQIDNR